MSEHEAVDTPSSTPSTHPLIPTTSDGMVLLWDNNRATIPAYVDLFDEFCEENSLFIEYAE